MQGSGNDMRVCFPRSGPPSTLCRQPSPTSATWSRSTGAAHPPGGFTYGASISDAALACRRLVECCEEEVVIDYASDLNTSACVWVASPHASSHFCSPCALTLPSPDAFSYGSGFTPRPDGTRCSWDLTRLIENPGNVLRAVNSCLPGVTQCVHRPWAGAWRLETRAAHSLPSLSRPPAGRGCTTACCSPPSAGTRRTTTCTASTTCTTAPRRPGTRCPALQRRLCRGP